MAQVAANYYSDDGAVDYTPGSAVTCGDVVVIGNRALVADHDIAANVKGSLATEGIFAVPKKTGAWTVGLPVYWDATGDPDNGTAGTGAASQIAGGTFMGIATATAASGDDYGYVELQPQAKRAWEIPTATVAATGSVQGDAALVAEGFTLVTAADATKGVLLPTARAGAVCILKNNVAAILKVWPSTSDAVNAGSVNAAFSVPASTSVMLIAYDATTWYSTPLVPS